MGNRTPMYDKMLTLGPLKFYRSCINNITNILNVENLPQTLRILGALRWVCES